MLADHFGVAQRHIDPPPNDPDAVEERGKLDAEIAAHIDLANRIRNDTMAGKGACMRRTHNLPGKLWDRLIVELLAAICRNRMLRQLGLAV